MKTTLFVKNTLIVSSLLVSISATSAQAASAGRAPSAVTLKQKIEQTMRSGQSLKVFYAQVAQEYGASAIPALLKIAQNTEEKDELRWASLFGLAKIAGKESLGVVKKFMTNASWLLRDAALKTAAALDAKELDTDIEARLQDEALVVRTTAVDTIHHLKLAKAAPKLVNALFDPINYHQGKPLWIHKHILTTLRDLRYREAVPRLVELLQARDHEPMQLAIVQTLESLTGRSFADKPLREQIYLWKRNTLADVTF